MGCRVNRTSVEVYGPVHLLNHLSAAWERARISNEMIQFMITRESSNFCVCGWSQMVMERKWPDLTVLSVVTRIIGPRCGKANKLTCTDTTRLTHPSQEFYSYKILVSLLHSSLWSRVVNMTLITLLCTVALVFLVDIKILDNLVSICYCF